MAILRVKRLTKWKIQLFLRIIYDTDLKTLHLQGVPAVFFLSR